MTDARDAVPGKGPLGVFGGMFDPVHQGHLHLAETLATELELDEVRMVPCADPPHRDRPRASGEDRSNMLRLALEPYPRLRLDDRELQRKGLSCTVDTLVSLHDEGHAPLYLFLGGDTLAGFCEWHRWRDILRLARLVVAERPGHATQMPPEMRGHKRCTPDEIRGSKAGNICVLPIGAPDVSSSMIRGGARDHLPRAVAEYIDHKELYRDE